MVETLGLELGYFRSSGHFSIDGHYILRGEIFGIVLRESLC
jgi:hypothetical protein